MKTAISFLCLMLVGLLHAGTASSLGESTDVLTNSLGMKFVPVPGTKVKFCIWDVRVQDFEAFVKASGYDATGSMYSFRIGIYDKLIYDKYGDTWQSPGFSQGPMHPVVGVNWNDAQAFCKWLSKKENKTYRLPTDAEWSVAVGLNESSGGTPKSKNGKVAGVYPWGTNWPPPSGAGNYAGSEVRSVKWPGLWKTIEGYRDDYICTSPVGSFTANQFGLYDMGGNVWQWCEDEYSSGSVTRLLRGGAWIVGNPARLLSSFRLDYYTDSRCDNFGFRCVCVVGSSR